MIKSLLIHQLFMDVTMIKSSSSNRLLFYPLIRTRLQEPSYTLLHNHSIINLVTKNLPCLRYNLDLDYIPTNPPWTCKKSKLQVICNRNSLIKKDYIFVTHATVTVALLSFAMLFSYSNKLVVQLFKTSLP